MANIIEPFLWEVVETLYFKLVQMDHSNSFLIKIVFFFFLAQSWSKDSLFDLKKIETVN